MFQEKDIVEGVKMISVCSPQQTREKALKMKKENAFCHNATEETRE